MKTYGYIRVSTKEQNEDRQLMALAPYGIPKSHLFMDKLSGKDFNRPAYRKLMRRLKEGDLVIIKSIDRLGRNYNEIIEQWRVITKEKKVLIKVLDMPLLDAKDKHDLTQMFIADLVLQILSYVAQTERENIRQRQMEGIEAAKLKGVRFGRPRMAIPYEFEGVKDKWLQKEISSRTAAAYLNISQDTFLRWCKGL